MCCAAVALHITLHLHSYYLADSFHPKKPLWASPVLSELDRIRYFVVEDVSIAKFMQCLTLKWQPEKALA